MFTWFFTLLRSSRGKTLAVAQRQMRESLAKTGIYLSVIFIAHIVAMRVFEGINLPDALWLTLTTVTTVGYGDLSAASLPGRAATVVLLYMGGIFVLAKIAGDYFDYRTEIRLRKIRGEWDWKMHGHILIINTPGHDGEQYFSRLIRQFRESQQYRDHPIQILTTGFPDGLPDSLTRLADVVHYNGRADDPESLEAVNADQADVIVVLAKDEHDRGSDSKTFDIMHRLSEKGIKGTVLAECVGDRNRERIIQAGANIVTRPMRAYPEMIVRGFVAPGSEQIIENMFTSASDEYMRFEVEVSNMSWKEIVCCIINSDLGTAVAYVDTDKKLHCNPPANDPVKASALILMVREDNKPDQAKVARALQGGNT